MKTQVELLKECCDIKDAVCVKYQKRIAELEEENKMLKKYKDKDALDIIRWSEKLREENEELKTEKKELKEINKHLYK